MITVASGKSILVSPTFEMKICDHGEDTHINNVVQTKGCIRSCEQGRAENCTGHSTARAEPWGHR